MRSGRLLAAVFAIALVGASPALAAPPSSTAGSLYSGPPPSPGPSILYQPTAVAPQLTNSGVWHAAPILASGATASHGGAFLYQAWPYDDRRAREPPDPNAPHSQGDASSTPARPYP